MAKTRYENQEHQSNSTIMNTNKSSHHDSLHHGNYKTQFIEMSAIGSGGFGTVFKVKHRLDYKIYAVIRVQFGDINEDSKQRVLREVNSLAKLDSDFVVKYYHSWLESNHLFIQMEFCSQNLKSVLKDKPIVFERQPEEEMNEILESVEYLHSYDPPVIHRDLKPENILIDPNFKCNRCVKLCDFGLATDHNTDGRISSPFAHTVCGTFGYIAPEVLMGKQYDHKSDIYSLAIIGEELFGIDLQDWKLIEAKKLSFTKCIQSIYGTLLEMMSTPFWRQRPECRDVLAKHNEVEINGLPRLVVQRPVSLCGDLSVICHYNYHYNKHQYNLLYELSPNCFLLFFHIDLAEMITMIKYLYIAAVVICLMQMMMINSVQGNGLDRVRRDACVGLCCANSCNGK
ncbi:unnamed protein product [Medioppia subpectinata]|uniref:non-specific serine/threonine protein kinase n=1 Tax=Medioppia subpectinata TaxID=1979941 RepID=A0A7R9PTA7_9ACAR|nr:unnamed protein product [Medioppia subpectinata]CAG2100303.1 unnamed protein product [Medioppia subpectinata]